MEGGTSWGRLQWKWHFSLFTHPISWRAWNFIHYLCKEPRILALRCRGHRGVLRAAGGRAGQAGGAQAPQGAAAELGARASAVGPAALRVQTIPCRRSLRAAPRLLQPHCGGAQARAAAPVGSFRRRLGLPAPGFLLTMPFPKGQKQWRRLPC